MSDPIYRRRRGGPSYKVAAVAHGRIEEMKEPEVYQLAYDVIVDDPLHEISDEAPPIKISLGAFDCVLDGGTLTARAVRDTFADPMAASHALQPHLRNWMSFAHLTQGVLLRFHLRHYWARNAATGPDAGPRASVATFADDSEPVEMRAPTAYGEFPPPPPADWRTTDDLEVLRMRLHDVYRYRAAIAVEAYLLLSYLEEQYGDRQTTAAALNVDFKVLDKMGKLTSTKRDLLHGRKATKKGAPAEPLTGADRLWLFDACQVLLIRLAVADPAAHPTLTMAQVDA